MSSISSDSSDSESLFRKFKKDLIEEKKSSNSSDSDSDSESLYRNFKKDVIEEKKSSNSSDSDSDSESLYRNFKKDVIEEKKSSNSSDSDSDSESLYRKFKKDVICKKMSVISSNNSSDPEISHDQMDSDIVINDLPASAVSSKSPTSPGKSTNLSVVSNLKIVEDKEIEDTQDSHDDNQILEDEEIEQIVEDEEIADSQVPDDDNDIIYIGEFRNDNPPQQEIVQDEEIEIIKQECIKRGKFEDNYAKFIKKEKLDEYVQKTTWHPVKNPDNENQSGPSSSCESSLPPCVAEQNKSLEKAESFEKPFGTSVDLTFKASITNDASPAQPVTSTTPSTSINFTDVRSQSSVNLSDNQMDDSTSNYRSFDPHDICIGVSDRHVSEPSSEKSFSSDVNKIFPDSQIHLTSMDFTTVGSHPTVISTDNPMDASTSNCRSFVTKDQHSISIGVSDRHASVPSSEKSSSSDDSEIYPNSNKVLDLDSQDSDDDHDFRDSGDDYHNELDKSNGIRFIKGKFPPRFEKKNDEFVKAPVNNFFFWNNCIDLTTETTNTKDTSQSPPSSVNVGEKLVTYSLCPHSPIITSTTSSNSIDNINVSSCSSVIPYVPIYEPISDDSNEVSHLGEEISEMNLELTFESDLLPISGEKRSSSSIAEHLSNESIKISRSVDISESSSNVLENNPPLLNQSQAVPKEDKKHSSNGLFSGSSETTASVYNNTDNGSQNRTETETTEISFRETFPLQQSNSFFSKNIDHSATSVNSHIEIEAQHNSMADPHGNGLSPQLGGFEAVTVLCSITGFPNSKQILDIPAVPSPPIVLSDSSQQDFTFSTCDALPLIGATPNDSTSESEEKVHCLPIILPFEESYGKGEGNSEMKFEFTFESELEQLSEAEEKSSASSGHLSNKSMNISRPMDASTSSTNVDVNSTISLSADELNLIQYDKKVSKNDTTTLTPMEHLDVISEGHVSEISESFSVIDETSVSNGNKSSQSREDAETERCLSATSVKSQNQMGSQDNTPALYCAGPVIPSLIDFEDGSTHSTSMPVVGFPTIFFNSSLKGEGNSEMKLEITPELEQLPKEKGRSSASSGHLSNKSMNISRPTDASTSSTNFDVRSTISLSADELNLIQSDKKVSGIQNGSSTFRKSSSDLNLAKGLQTSSTNIQEIKRNIKRKLEEKSFTKVSKRPRKKSETGKNLLPSDIFHISEYLLNYNKLPKDFECPKCSFSCLSKQTYDSHSCSKRIEELSSCIVVIKENCCNFSETSKTDICPKCCFTNIDNITEHSCEDRINQMNSCFVQLERINKPKLNTESSQNVDPMKIIDICSQQYMLHQQLICRAKENFVKKAKICTSVDEVMKYIVEPFMQIDEAFDPHSSNPDLSLNLTLPYQNQAFLFEAAKQILGNVFIS